MKKHLLRFREERKVAAVLASGTTGNGDGGAPRPAPVFRGVTALVARRQGSPRGSRPPSRLAAAGDARLVLTADPSRCLLLYPRAAWEPIQARLMALSSFDAKIRALQRLLVGHADDVEVDAAGRILVPPALRRYASLDKRRRARRAGPQVRAVGRRGSGRSRPRRRSRSPPDGLPPELAGFSL